MALTDPTPWGRADKTAWPIENNAVLQSSETLIAWHEIHSEDRVYRMEYNRDHFSTTCPYAPPILGCPLENILACEYACISCFTSLYSPAPYPVIINIIIPLSLSSIIFIIFILRKTN